MSFNGKRRVVRTPYPIETYNDLEANVVKFFTVLREQEAELTRALYLPSYAREAYQRACQDDDVTPYAHTALFCVDPTGCQ